MMSLMPAGSELRSGQLTHPFVFHIFTCLLHISGKWCINMHCIYVTSALSRHNPALHVLDLAQWRWGNLSRVRIQFRHTAGGHGHMNVVQRDNPASRSALPDCSLIRSGSLFTLIAGGVSGERISPESVYPGEKI